MRGFEIAQLLSKFGSEVYKSVFGILSIDQLPNSIPEQNFIVCNLSPSQDKGKYH